MADLSSSELSEDDEENFDKDICTKDEIDKLFTLKHQISIEEKVSSKNSYILGLCGNSSFNVVAAGFSDGTVKIFDIVANKNRTNLSITEKSNYLSSNPSLTSANSTCGLKYLDDDKSDCLLVGRTDGTITLYDLRTNKIEYIFQDNDGENERKPILSFDVNSNKHFICCGTEKISNDAFILFFDIRQKKLLGNYMDSHTDDITTIKFHPNNSDTLMTGSTDGLINIFDISQTTEDDALMKTINSESSIYRLNWHKNNYANVLISCITHTNDLLICDYDESEILYQFNRETITKSIKSKSIGNCNLINCHNLITDNDNSIFTLVNSNFNNGKTLRSLKIQNKNLLPFSEFEDNKQIIRDSIFSEKQNLIITAGESEIITIWNFDSSVSSTIPSSTDNLSNSITSSNNLKIKTNLKEKLYKKKPY